jgi:hypothetical protein
MTTIAIRGNSISKVAKLDYILLDGSGSMRDKWWTMLSALDTYVGELKTNQVGTHLTLQVFDSQSMEQVVRDTTIASWVPFSESAIGANFTSTPLYDAIMVMTQRLRDLNPENCSILIVTDGEENASQYCNETKAREYLDWCRAHGWQVTFMGCDFNNSSQARLLGADDTNSIGVQKALLSDATKSFAKKRAHNALYGTDINFTADEKIQFGGYLGKS